MRKFITGSLIIIFLVTGCNTANSTVTKATQTIVPVASILDQSDQNPGPTLTPFQPILPTNTSVNTSTTTTPTIEPTASNSTAVHLGLPRPSGQVNILILGSDFRPGQGYRTDIIMVLSLNPEKGTASLTSFPRDLYVNIPGVGMSRINAAQPYGGFALTTATLKENFDITVDYYVMTTFSGFKSIVDTLGGINVNAAVSLDDTCDLPQAVNTRCIIPAGMNTMDGATALWYVRSRHTGSDFDRSRRAQEVIAAIFQKTMSLDALNRGSELYDLFINSVDTNLNVSTFLKLLPFSANIVANPSIVKRYAIGANNVTNYIVPENGSMVLIPDPISIGEIIKQAFY